MSISKFKIEMVFSLSSRNYFVMAGNILEGGIGIGMQIITEGKDVLIKGIEFVDRIGDSAICFPAIVLEFKSKTEEECLRNLFPPGKIISIQ